MDGHAMGALGGILGGLLVAGALLWLARPLREEQRAREAARADAAAEALGRVQLAIAADERLARTFRTGVQRYDFLDDDQKLQLDLLLRAAFRALETLYLAAAPGTPAEARLEAEQAPLLALLREAGGRAWWRQHRESVTPAFASFVEGRLAALDERAGA